MFQIDLYEVSSMIFCLSDRYSDEKKIITSWLKPEIRKELRRNIKSYKILKKLICFDSVCYWTAFIFSRNIRDGQNLQTLYLQSIGCEMYTCSWMTSHINAFINQTSEVGKASYYIAVKRYNYDIKQRRKAS